MGMDGGHGSGASIEFEDHRPYAPGDDPRHINWQAWARTGHLTMKLFRREVSPVIDLIIDQSASMRLFDDKARRSLALALFVSQEARRHGCPVRIHGVDGQRCQRLDGDAISLGEAAGECEHQPVPPTLKTIPLQSGGMRVFISDLLYPGPCRPIVNSLAAGSGRGIIFAPWAAAEFSPDWSGNLRLIDCESAQARDVHATPSLVTRYQTAWQRHFEAWANGCRQLGIALVRLPAEIPIADSLLHHALPSGAVSPCN